MNRHLFAVIAVIFTASSLASAQPLADLAPADTILYVGWTGSQNLGDEYEQSHLKAILDSGQLRQLLDQTVPQVIERIRAEDKNAAQLIEQARNLLTMMLRHPTAIYVSGTEPVAGMPVPRVALMCRAGDDAVPIQQAVTSLMTQAQLPSTLIQMVIDGDMLTLQFGIPAGEGTLAEQSAFADTMKQMVSDPVFCFYFNAEQLCNYVDKQVQSINNPDATQLWQSIRGLLALDGVKRLAVTAGFDEGDWVSSMFVEAPAPRRGIAKLFDPGEPLSDETLRLIPQTASMAGAFRFDLAGLCDQVLSVMQLLALAQPEINSVLTQFKEQTGLDIREDIIAAIGDEWVYYTDANVGGNGMLGFVLINRSPDAQKLGDVLSKLFVIANAMLTQAIDDENVNVRIRSFEQDGVTLHYLATPLVAPTFAAGDDGLYIALQPQTVVTAMRHYERTGKSILDNQEFTKLRKQVAAKQQVAYFEFYDLPQTLGSGYQATLMLSRLYIGIMDVLGADAPPLVLPPLDVLSEHVTPAGSFAWTDDAGVYVRSRSPFPGSSIFGGDQSMLIVQQTMMLGTLIPALQQGNQPPPVAQDQTPRYIPNTNVSPDTVYVDATHGPSGNTTLADGSPLSVEAGTLTDAPAGNDGLWRHRSFGNTGVTLDASAPGTSIYEANGDSVGGTTNTEDAPTLKTTVTNLAPGQYHAYVYFWSDTSSWRIRASLDNVNFSVFAPEEGFYGGLTPNTIHIAPSPDGTIVTTPPQVDGAPLMAGQANRRLFQADLGIATVGPAGVLEIYVDSDTAAISGNDSNHRTWYDGVGYELVTEAPAQQPPATVTTP